MTKSSQCKYRTKKYAAEFVNSIQALFYVFLKNILRFQRIHAGRVRAISTVQQLQCLILSAGEHGLLQKRPQ